MILYSSHFCAAKTQTSLRKCARAFAATIHKEALLDTSAWAYKGGFCTCKYLQGPVAQSVASVIADPGVTSLMLARLHTFMETDHEIFSTVIFLLPLIQEVYALSICTECWLTT